MRSVRFALYTPVTAPAPRNLGQEQQVESVGVCSFSAFQSGNRHREGHSLIRTCWRSRGLDWTLSHSRNHPYCRLLGIHKNFTCLSSRQLEYPPAPCKPRSVCNLHKPRAETAIGGVYRFVISASVTQSFSITFKSQTVLTLARVDVCGSVALR